MISQPPQNPPSNEPNGNGDGRDGRGKFAHGNKLGRGNPDARRIAALRRGLFSAVTPERIRAVVAKLISSAESGDVAAAKELLDRVFGKAVAQVQMECTGVGQQTQVTIVYEKDWFGNDAHAAIAVAATPSKADPTLPGPEQNHRGGPALGQDGNGTPGNGGRPRA